jgi:predicted nuclease of predicted toxin-antitoxin system
LRFLLDAQLPQALTARFSEAGHTAFHMLERLPADASDLDVARAANLLGAMLASKDEDFVDLSVRGVLQTPFLWIRSGDMTTARLWMRLAPLLPEAVRAFQAGERIVEIR